MTAYARPVSRPARGAVPRSRTSGSSADPVNTGSLRLCALPSAPFWARQYTRLFLAGCPAVSADAAGTVQLIVSELVTNAVCASASLLGVITLSLRACAGTMVIEVRDQSPGTPVLVHPDRDCEQGRGLMLVDALSREWGYCAEPRGGKMVYAVLLLT